MSVLTPQPPEPPIPGAATPPRLTRQSTIAALVPHYHCEQWLDDCLSSLAQQTRPLDAIVVLDDGSPAPPVDIVKAYPHVTLLAAPDNVGPYRLLQQAIDDTDYDGYLFQDADDWSGRDRLERLLAEAGRTGAELVGCQEALICCDIAEVQPVRYPLDVNRELAMKPGLFGLAHHASVVSRDLMVRIGGFATGLRFGGDSELLQRAVHAARVRNVPQCCYFRRERQGSLTTDASTGMASPERLALSATLRWRAATDAAARSEGRSISLLPSATAGPVVLTHLAGPALCGRRSGGMAPVVAGTAAALPDGLTLHG
jgi:hypothetical protein